MMLMLFRSRVAVPSKLESIRRSRVHCSLCNQLYISKAGLCNGMPKLQTSNVMTIDPSTKTTDGKKKPGRRKARLTTELLELQGSSLNQMKAKVKKISSKNLDKLHHVVADPSGEENIPEHLHVHEVNKKASELLGDCSLHVPHVPEDPIEDEAPIKYSSKATIGPELRKKLSQVDAEALSQAGKDRGLQDSILCYLELCVSCGFPHRGWVTLNYYVKRGTHTESSRVSDPRLFDALMHGYASTGNYDKIMDVWNLMESADIQPTLISFAYRIEAIARSKKVEKTELLTETISLLEQKDYELNDLFVATPWVGDSQEVVLEAVRVIRPQFSPIFPAPELDYDNPLLNRLNGKDNSTLASPAVQTMTEDLLMSRFRDQLDLEKKALVTVRSVEKESELDKMTLLYRQRLDELMQTWEQHIITALNREIASLNMQHRNYRLSYMQLNLYPYLVVLDKRLIKDIIMQEIKKIAEGSETFSPISVILHRCAGAQLRQRYIVKSKLESGVLHKIEKMYQKYVRWYLNPQVNSACNARQLWQMVKHEVSGGPSVDLDPAVWPPSVLSGVGKFMYKIILRDIKIDVNILRANSKSKRLLPAFYTVYRHQGGYLKEEVKPHPVLSKLYRDARLPYLTFNVNDTPSLCPPIPWSSIHSGGYIVAKTNLIRLPQQAMQQWERMKSAPPKQLYPLYDSLNQLSSIPWKVNQPVLDTIIEVFNSGGSPKLDIPEPPLVLPPPEKVTSEMSDVQRSQLFKERILMRRKKAEMYSLWCDARYRLSLANHFRDEVFWLPHNMDFRGRVYPCPPHLNHLGSDMSRSMLLFAKGQPLGPNGLDWLKIHVINLTGLKKRNSVADRLAYANEMLPLIIDSAKNPLHGKKWWMESEEPWQTLACCLEMFNATNCPDGPENYISHFPIHQDGSCNGLQHYAALGRDSAGAFSVNLAPADEPQDVYSAVAAIVERARSKDAAEGNEIAKVLDGFVRRKVVKQTVMTTVYGVTRFGARLQIAKQLKDIDDFPQDDVWLASQYLASRTFDSIREMFSSTREIQDWFTESARMISSVCGKNVEYLTPLGLPVVQPYVRIATSRSFKNALGKSHEIQKMDLYERPNVMKQKNAFPPNFIHSLDSSHMMLTSLHSERAGITFVSVHDCFWTHACNVEIMNKICREQFVSLHSQPILEDLSAFLFDLYGYDKDSLKYADEKALAAMQRLNRLLTTLPRQGDFDLKNVLDSVYFFS